MLSGIKVLANNAFIRKMQLLSLYYILFVNLVFVCFSNIDNMEPVEVSVSFSHLDQVIFKVSRFKTSTALEKKIRFLIQMFYKDKAPSGKDNHLVYTYNKMLQNIHEYVLLMASLPQWTWVWASSGSWWWTGKPAVLQSIASQRVGHDWVTQLNWNVN